jgi:hypothetical protein
MWWIRIAKGVRLVLFVSEAGSLIVNDHQISSARPTRVQVSPKAVLHCLRRVPP